MYFLNVFVLHYALYFPVHYALYFSLECCDFLAGFLRWFPGFHYLPPPNAGSNQTRLTTTPKASLSQTAGARSLQTWVRNNADDQESQAANHVEDDEDEAAVADE